MFSRAAGLPDRIELRVVDVQAGAVGLARAEPEVLDDLAEAQRAGLDVGLELRRGALAQPGADALEVDVREHHHPVAVRAVPRSPPGSARSRSP